MVSTDMSTQNLNDKNLFEIDDISLFSDADEIEKILEELEMKNMVNICLSSNEIDEYFTNIDLLCYENIEELED